VCRNSNCDAPFVQVTATAKHVGAKVAIYLDDAAVTTQRYTDAELVNVGTCSTSSSINRHHNFGRESDIDGNGVVYVFAVASGEQAERQLQQHQQRHSRLLFQRRPRAHPAGLQRGRDFLQHRPRSGQPRLHDLEVVRAGHLPPTFIHEFQHMISFGQHALIRGGGAEDNWLNEGLSHYAERAWRTIDSRCQNPTLGGRRPR